MKYVNIIFIILTGIVLLVHSVKNDDTFLPHLPLGEFRLNYKAILKCNKNPNSEILQSFYFNKISKNVTGVKGNLTLKKPLDDSYTVNLNFAIKDLIGGWKDNAHVFSAPKACSSMKLYSGTLWNQVLSSLGVNSTDCPIPKGVYYVNNYVLFSNVSNTNIPKSFFYGTYKIRFYFTDNLNLQHGCVTYIVELKRPWETE